MHYTAIARGKVVSNGQFLANDSKVVNGASNDNVTSWTTSMFLRVDESFAPAFKLLVYYIRSDGEVVADEATM